MLTNKSLFVAKKCTHNIFSMRNVCDLDGIKMLEVDFTYKCDNRCPYCYASKFLTNSASGTPDVQKIAHSIIEQQKRSNYTTLSFLGGEPLLFINELLECIELVLKEVTFAHIVITSTLPYNCIDNYDTLVKLLKYVDGLHISMHHCESRIHHNAIYATGKHDRNDLLYKLLNTDIGKCKIAVHINLAKDVCNTKEDILENYYYYAAISSRSLNKLEYIRFNEIYVSDIASPIESYSFEKIFGIKMLSPYSHGCYSNITYLFPNGNLTAYLKRPCFLTANNKTACLSDLLKILYKVIIRRRHKYYEYCNVIKPNGKATLSRKESLDNFCSIGSK